MKATGTASLAALCLVTIGACGGQVENGDADPADESAPVSTPSETPESDGQAASDEWGDQMWDDHVEDLVAWWNKHYDADCDITEADCYEHFSDGDELMADFGAALTESDSYESQPDYVAPGFAGEVTRTARALERYSHACPAETDCDAMAEGLESDVYEVVSETDTWWD